MKIYSSKCYIKTTTTIKNITNKWFNEATQKFVKQGQTKSNQRILWEEIEKLEQKSTKKNQKQYEESTNLRTVLWEAKQNWQILGPTNQKKEKTQINRIRNDQGDIIRDSKEIRNKGIFL